jgi:nascent polypeptide-associated complex subunit alpha
VCAELEKAEAAGAGEGEGEAAGSGKQNRNEKKARKAISRLGLKQVPGITRLTIKKNKSVR